MTSTTTSITDWKLVHPAHAGTRALTSVDLWAIPRVGKAEPTPDERQAVVPVTTFDMDANKGTTRLWLVDLTDGGAAPRALTSTVSSSGQPSVSPDGKRVAFLRKTGDAEKPRNQVFVMPIDGGEAEQVADLPLGAFDVQWMPDGAALVVGAMLLKGHLTIAATTTERDRRADDPVKVNITEDNVFRYWDHWLTPGETPHLFHVDIATRELRDLMPDSEELFSMMDPAGSFDVHPDGTEIAYASIRWDGDANRLRSSVTRLDLASGECTRIAPTDAFNASDPRYATCGRSIVYGVTYDPDFYADRTRLMRYDLASQTEISILADWEHSPGSWDLGDDGSVVLTAGVAARNELFRLGEADVPTQIAGDGSISGVTALTNGRVLFSRNHTSQPTEVFLLNADGSERPLTQFTDEALDGVALGEVRETTFEGAEGAEIQMFVVLPPLTDTHANLPFVNVVHGGPHGTSGDTFHPRWNSHLFAAPGYVVATPNFQGSTTWGQEFARCIQGTWGDRPYGDVMAATDVMIDAGVADPDRMAIAGGSYGGYLATWVTTQTDRFRCAINHAGVFDTQGMFASDVIQSRHLSLGGRPWDDHEGLDRWNPLRQAKTMQTPMLVMHGERDYRVPVTQGLLCYSILRDRGVPARLVHFPDENHWVLKPRNSIVWYREFHDWLARFLSRDGDAAAETPE